MPRQSRSTQKTRQSATRRPRWRRWIIGAIMTMVVMGIGGTTWVATRTPAHTAQFDVSVDNPLPARYTTGDAVVMSVGTNKIAMPQINQDRELTGAGALRVYYNFISGDYAPAMRMDIDDADLVNAVKMTPAIRGTWSRPGPNMLVFTPAENWPADTKFTVKIARRLMNPDAHANRRRIRFETPKRAATVDTFDVYPTGTAGTVVGTGVVSFNYPTDITDRDVRVTLNGKQIDAHVQMDTARRTALITTAPITVTNTAQNLGMVISGNAPRTRADTTIAAADNFFKISDITTTVVDDENGTPHQVLILTTTAAARGNTKWDDHIHAYLLPRVRDTDERGSHRWASDEVTPDVLAHSTKLTLTPITMAAPAGAYQYAFAYTVSDNDTRYIYVDVTGDIESDIGFAMKNGADKIMRAPYPERTVRIAGDGALLTLNGDRKIGIVARGGASAAYINVAKVKASEINHLISQTYNIFTNLDFKSWSFGTDDMSVVFTKAISFADASPIRVNYASLDLGAYLDRTGNDRTGIFVIQTGATQSQANYSDRRLILVTDLGIIRKINANGTSALFVSYLNNGKPAGDVDISVLGRNGNAIWTGKTNANGRADIPTFGWNEYRGAREPVAIVARRGSDVSFIPYDASGPQVVEYSKFDTGGIYGTPTGAMTAYVFSDRGIYRPGNEFIIGAIVREKTFQSLAGIPVRMMIDDARGRTIVDKKTSMKSDGMFDVRHTLGADASLGEYTVTLYSLTGRGANDDVIGRTTFMVQEFMPDTMKITADIPGATDTGWMRPDNMTATVTLRNLFGTPAMDRRIMTTATLTPTQFTFPKFSGYAFTPNVMNNTGISAHSGAAPRAITLHPGDVRTDDTGTATVTIPFDRPVDAGTYMLNITMRGFDGDAGRSVQTTVATRVSNDAYVIGWRANGNLDYINRNAARQIHVVAVGPDGNAMAVDDMQLRVIARENLTSLVRDASGYYKYQSTTRDRTVRTDKITIPTAGKTISLDTKTPGTYLVQILDANDRVWAAAPYRIAGDANIAMTRDAAAELQITLNKSNYAPGDDIAVSVTAPYAGSGLITIERDRVYAYRWFNAAGTTSVQHIRVPDDFDGTGYVNVSFVRDINSRDIFTSPYTYAVAPFTARADARKIDVQLTAPNVIQDKKLTVTYQTNQTSRLMIFAVDTGILQVARHTIPNPIAAFYQKYALNVQTYQILSLLLPEYKILREFAKTGGGDYDGGHNGDTPAANPFGRMVNAPVAFYSGIIDARAGKTGTVTFDIPDYFNGDMRIYAVAANQNAVGSASTRTLVQSPVIVTPSAPLFAAPGDTFTAGAIITNMTDNATVDTRVSVSPNMTLTTDDAANLTIKNGAEKMITFGVRADTVGASDIQINATAGNDTGTGTATLAVRPIYPLTTDIKTGTINSATTKIRRWATDMYPDDRVRQIYITRGMSAWMRPLVQYLNKYDFDCTEQLTSRALPYALMPDDKIMGTTFDTSATRVNATIAKLRGRQNGNGSFALWPNGGINENTPALTAYVVQFLMHARDGGFTVPDDMLGRGIDYMRDATGRPIADNADAIDHARAIYLMTRDGFVTTNYISAFKEYADAHMPTWAQTIAGPYIAAAYQMMGQSNHATDIIGKYRPHRGTATYTSMFDNTTANDAIAVYIMRKYFGMTNDALNDGLASYINTGNYDSYTSAMAILGLMDGDASDTMPPFTVTAGDKPMTGQQSGDTWMADIPADVSDIAIACDECTARPITWTIIQSGYPRAMRAMDNGIAVTRHYYDAAGNRITSATAGETVMVKITARARDGSDVIPNVAITDLLPGAMTAIPDTITGPITYGAIREDRVQIFADITRGGSEFTYTATVTTPGRFAIAPINAASMYNPSIRAVGDGGTFIVTDGTTK